MIDYLLGSEAGRYAPGGGDHAGGDIVWRIHEAFNRRFERFRDRYREALGWALGHRPLVVGVFGGFFAVSLLLAAFSGQDFFPQVDAGQFRLHVRAPASTRLEATDQLFNAVEARIRQTIPPDELGLILTNIGLPVGGVNLAFSDGATTGSADGEILVSLKAPGNTFAYVRELRRQLPAAFPQATFFFSAADIVSQILNFGLPAPIDIQVVGANPANQELARRIAQRITSLPGVVDVHVHQVTAAPALNINVDRTRAAQVGLTQRDIASSVLVSLAGSGDGSPNFWLDPKNGVNYRVVVQTPQYRIDSVDALAREPLLATTAGGGPQLLTNLATVDPGTTPAVANHYNVQRVFDVFASVQDRDLGGAARDIGKVVADERRHLPRGSTLTVRGQVQSMNSAFLGLGGGMIFAVVLVYALMVVNFQSWLDPFIIITALPGAIAGALWALFVTQTTVNVPSLMGAIMSIGVATANSILVVTFANDERQAGHDAVSAALSAGVTRLRPVLMTALAMIIGMFPMALGLGEGGEQNAPLGRAVIGRLDRFHATGKHPGHPGRADLRARRRLSQAAPRRHRRPGATRPGARGDRHAGARSASRAGAGRAGASAGQPRAGTVRPRAGPGGAPAQRGDDAPQRRDTRALARAQATRPGGPAGRRQLPGGVRRQPRRRGGRPGEHRGARGQRERCARQRDGERGGPAPPHGSAVVPDAARAAFGHRHRPQRGPGFADLLRPRAERHAGVPRGTDRQLARLRERAADLRVVHHARPVHGHGGARASQPRLQGERGQHRGSPGSCLAHALDGDPHAKPGRPAPAGHVCRREVPRDADGSAVPAAFERGYHPIGPAPRGDRRSRQRRASHARPARARSRIERRGHRRPRRAGRVHPGAGGQPGRGRPRESRACLSRPSGQLDKKKREALLHQIQRILHEQAVQAPVYHLGFPIGVGPRVDDSMATAIPGFYTSPEEDLKLRRP